MSTKKLSAEEELEKQYNDYKGQFEEWKERNKESVGTDAYIRYVKQFEDWERDVEKRRAIVRQKAEMERKAAEEEAARKAELERTARRRQEESEAASQRAAEQNRIANRQRRLVAAAAASTAAAAGRQAERQLDAEPTPMLHPHHQQQPLAATASSSSSASVPLAAAAATASSSLPRASQQRYQQSPLHTTQHTLAQRIQKDSGSSLSMEISSSSTIMKLKVFPEKQPNGADYDLNYRANLVTEPHRSTATTPATTTTTGYMPSAGHYPHSHSHSQQHVVQPPPPQQQHIATASSAAVISSQQQHHPHHHHSHHHSGVVQPQTPQSTHIPSQQQQQPTPHSTMTMKMDAGMDGNAFGVQAGAAGPVPMAAAAAVVQPVEPPQLWGSEGASYTMTDPMFRRWNVRAAPPNFRVSYEPPPANVTITPYWLLLEKMREKKLVLAPSIKAPTQQLPHGGSAAGFSVSPEKPPSLFSMGPSAGPFGMPPPSFRQPPPPSHHHNHGQPPPQAANFNPQYSRYGAGPPGGAPPMFNVPPPNFNMPPPPAAAAAAAAGGAASQPFYKMK